MTTLARVRPILFSSPMVRALLAGKKTQTRRIMKPQPLTYAGSWTWVCAKARSGVDQREAVQLSPYGVPGDRLWVRETINYRAGRGWFAADDSLSVIDTWPWKRNVLAAIHMPRGACRLVLRITDVRVQRVQEISEADARAEGVEPGLRGMPDEDPREVGYPSATAMALHEATLYRQAFARLWDEINGKRAPWASNPWVWAITFEVCNP